MRGYQVHLDRAHEASYREDVDSLVSPTVRVLYAILDDAESEHWGNQLAKDAGVSPGTIYGILNRLADAGWLSVRIEEPVVEESPSSSRSRRRGRDGRGTGAGRTLYKLTPTGLAAAQERVRDAAAKTTKVLQADVRRGWLALPETLVGAPAKTGPKRPR